MTIKADEAVAAMQRKNLEAAMTLAQMSMDTSQKILQLQVDVARSLFDEGVLRAKALAEVSSPQEAMDLRARGAQQMAEKMFECSRNVASMTAELQANLNRVMAEQLSASGANMMEAVQSMMGGMPINSHAAAEVMQNTFDSARKALEQVGKASAQAFSAFSPNNDSTTSRR